MSHPWTPEREHIARWRAKSNTDPREPLGRPMELRPESGPSVTEYYRAKHRRREFGRFFPLHEVLFSKRPRQ